MKVSRRAFIGTAAMAAAGCASGKVELPAKPEYHVFSRVFQFVRDYSRAAALVKKCGYDGIEWTCRPKGFIEPEKAERYLKSARNASDG